MGGRRLLATFALVLLSLPARPAVSGADHSRGVGPGHDAATGTATRTAQVGPNGSSDTRVMMGVNARSEAEGDVSGYFWVRRWTEPPVAGRHDWDFRGQVTCLRVIDNNRAIVGGVITDDRLDLPENPIEGTGFLGVYVDKDQLGTGEPDQSNSLVGQRLPGGVCPTSGPIAVPFQQGNYIVHGGTTP